VEPDTAAPLVQRAGTPTQRLTLVNNSSTSICTVCISPTTDPSWGADWLGSSTIPAGGSFTFTVPNGTYDVKAEDSGHNVLATHFAVSIPPTTSWSVP